MKRMLCVFLSVAILSLVFTIPACAQELSLSAQAYVLYCVENNTVILENNANTAMKPASTTKIMTTLLALEEAEKKDVLVEFDDSMASEGSSMYLKKGDVLHLSSLAKGMMMASGNDAANAVALTLCDSFEDFASLMNKRAKEIGMKNTNFVTPSGLDDENHYSTAYDMALLMAQAMKNESFSEIAGAKKIDVRFLVPQKQVTYNNHNRLLSLYEYCIGGKTGYTQSAGRCLVSCARNDSVTLVCVTFDASDDWNDHIKMYDYGFGRYSAIDTKNSENLSLEVVGSKEKAVPLYTRENTALVVKAEDKKRVKKTIYLPPFLYAPINENDYIGLVVYELDEKIVKKIPLYAKNSISVENNNENKTFFERLFD